MSARTVISHLVVAALAFGLGWLVFASGDASPGSGRAASAEPSAAFAEILRIDDPAERAVALAAFFEATDPSSAIMLRDLLVTGDPELHVDEIVETLFAHWWASSDPPAAFSNLVDPAWANRHPWVRTVIREWMRRDPEAAVAAIHTLPQNPTQGRVEAARVALDGWFEGEDFADPTPLLGLVRPLEVKARARAIERILDAMIEKRGIEATGQFVESVQPTSESIGISVESEMMARMGVALLDHDVEEAKAWAAKHGEGRAGVGVLKHLAYYWGRRDGLAAMEWAMTLPDTPEKPAVIKRVWLSWGFGDAEGAREWLHAREPEAVTQGIYARHLRHLAQEDPDRALELAQRTSDPELRERMLLAVGRGWMSADPEAAGAWLATAGLSPEAQQKIRSTPPRRRPDDPNPS